MSVAGPYPVTCYDPDYRAAVGCHGFGFWFRVLDSLGNEVDAGGAADELPHLVDLLEASWVYIEWPDHKALVDALRSYDPALHSEHDGVNRLIAVG